MQKLLFSVAFGLVAFVFTGCSKDQTDNPEKQAQQKPIQIAASVANASTTFAFDFFKTAQDAYKPADNVFLSPLSLHMALGMLVQGADTETKAEILRALKIDGLTQTEVIDSYKKLLVELPKADPKVKLALANAIFYQNSFPFESAFLNQMKTDFNAQVTGLPFTSADLATINKWASDNTNGKIKEVLKKLSPDLVMLLMNALYFKGDWTSQFSKSATKDEPFNLEDGSKKTVKMMHQETEFSYTANSEFQAVQLPYGNKQFVATVILPKEGKTVSDIINSFSAAKWDELQKGLIMAKVITSLPKFKVENDVELNNTMKSMGMLKAFSMTEADFLPMSKQKPLWVGFVKQNTFVDVNEEGTEAAAVTIIGIQTVSAGPQQVTFKCDRPFLFLISEKTSNTILFMGKIMDP